MADDEGHTTTVSRPRAGEESRSVRRRRVIRTTTPTGKATEPTGKATPATGKATTPAAGKTVRVPAPRKPPPAESLVDGAVPGNDPGTLRRWRLLALLLLVVLAGALVAAGLAGRSWDDRRQLGAARQQALAAARQTTVNFVSISAATVDADLRRISDGATGQFKDEFTGDMAQIRSAVLDNKVDSHGTVLRAAMVSASRRSAVVLVAVDATVKNTSAPDGRLSHYRIQVNMARDAHSGRWLVAQLQFVG
jgi:Mce-associated membrane protein